MKNRYIKLCLALLMVFALAIPVYAENELNELIIDTSDFSVGDVVSTSAGTFVITSVNNKTIAFSKAANKKNITVPATVTVSGTDFAVTQINAKAFTAKKIRKVTAGGNVTTIKKNAFKESKATKLILKTKKLTKASVKGSLKGSKVTTVQVKVSSKKATNKKYISKYKKYFKKSNSGRKVTVK